MFYAAVSLNFHRRDPKGLDHDKMVAELMDRYSPYPFVPKTHMQNSFGHLNGYSAIYYTYMWSLVISKDLFSRFRGNLMEPETAASYRREVLSRGGSKEAAAMVHSFLGRDYGFDAFADWLNS